MDRNWGAVRKIPSAYNGVHITVHRGAFTNRAWPFANLDGILMATSLHYVADQAAFIHACEPWMTRYNRGQPMAAVSGEPKEID